MRRSAPALFALLALLAVIETANAVLAPARVARDADWEAAAAEVRAGFRPGDLVVFAPAWADPVGRAHLGELVTPAMAGRSDADRYRRIWEVAIRGARAPETAGARPDAESDHGRVRVARYDRPAPVVVRYDFTDALGDARVSQTSAGEGGEGAPCLVAGPLAGEVDHPAFRCAATRVERRTLEIDYRPRRGVLVPVDGTRTTRLEYPAAALGAELVVYAGLHDYYARKSADGAVDLVVTIDGAKVAVMQVHNADGWRRQAIDTGRFAGAAHAVTFAVRSAAPAWRNLGLHVEARR